jgi:hypothetical protein
MHNVGGMRARTSRMILCVCVFMRVVVLLLAL